MTIEYNPLTPEIRENPYPIYAEMRRAASAHYVEALGLWAIPRYDDVLAVVRDHHSFSSSPMNFQSVREGFFGASAATIIGADPPIHTRLRNLVNRGFTPRRIGALEPRVRAIAEQLAEQLKDSSSFDLMADFAIPLPVTVIAEMLGVEADRYAEFKRWSDTVVSLISGMPTDDQRASLQPDLHAFRDYFLDAADRRRAQPREDLISALLRASDTEEALTAEEVITFAALLLVAGNETTTNLIGNAVLALLEYPDQLEEIRHNPALVPNLVEEALRYDAPVQGLFRLATRDVRVGDAMIPAGSLVMPLFASANRDERQFPDPDTFNVHRNTDGHLAFGFGIHFCLGAALARLEARIGLEVLFAHVPRLARCDQEIERLDSIFLRGPTRLRVSICK
jgi:cytochrome P450